MARVQYARSAEDDLLELWLTIAAENPAAADGVVDQLDEIARLLATRPEMGRARPELGEGVRSFPTRTPYLLFYLPRPDGVIIVRVLHHARDIDMDCFAWP